MLRPHVPAQHADANGCAVHLGSAVGDAKTAHFLGEARQRRVVGVAQCAGELLGEGRFGRLADDASFADALLALLDDGAARAHLERAGVERSREYDWSEIATEYRDVYIEAMELESRAPRLSHALAVR